MAKVIVEVTANVVTTANVPAIQVSFQFYLNLINVLIFVRVIQETIVDVLESKRKQKNKMQSR